MKVVLGQSSCALGRDSNIYSEFCRFHPEQFVLQVRLQVQTCSHEFMSILALIMSPCATIFETPFVLPLGKSYHFKQDSSSQYKNVAWLLCGSGLLTFGLLYIRWEGGTQCTWKAPGKDVIWLSTIKWIIRLVCPWPAVQSLHCVC